MSLAVDVEEFKRIFINGRGVPAQSPLPPGLFGYDAEYRNPYRQVDLERARQLLAEAGYPGGIDPETGKPLEHITFDIGDASTRTRVTYGFFVDAWRRARPRTSRSWRRPTTTSSSEKVRRSRRLSDLQLGLDRRLPGPGELPVPALESSMANNVSNERRAEHRQLQRTPTLRPSCILAMKDRENDAEPRRAGARACWRSWSASAPGSSCYHSESLQR